MFRNNKFLGLSGDRASERGSKNHKKGDIIQQHIDTQLYMMRAISPFCYTSDRNVRLWLVQIASRGGR